MPSSGSQVDITDVCWGGGLIQLFQAFAAGASLRLLLLLPSLTQAAHQHALDLLLACFENVLQCKRRGVKTFYLQCIRSITPGVFTCVSWLFTPV